MKRSLMYERLAAAGASVAAMAVLAACGGSGTEETSSGTFSGQSAAVVEPPATGWTDIAAEYQPFSLDASQVVRFGSDTRWVQATLAGASYCGIGTFGSDPAPGIAKTCQVQSAPAAQVAASGTWVTIAPQYGSFVLDAPQLVRFGRDTRWVERTVVRNGYCAVTSFGVDPAPGEYKECQVLQGGSGASGPVPSSPVVTRYSAETGRATIAWKAPNTLADGSPGNALTALTVYHGTQQGQQGPGGTGTTAVPNVPLNTTQLSLSLPAGTRWIAMTATNAAGESSSSPEIKVSVP
ncbi:MAG: hypothetical protein V4679_03850 [Pseudomonadota bacterium]